MPTFTILYFSNPVEGHEDGFNKWYDTHHLKEVLAVDGIVSAQRFRLAQTDQPNPPSHKYLAIYRWETEDLEATRKTLEAAVASGTVTGTPHMDSPHAVMWFYEPIGEPVFEQ
jgi:hypothetical protein